MMMRLFSYLLAASLFFVSTSLAQSVAFPGPGLSISASNPASSLTDFKTYWKLDEASGNRADSSANAVTLTDTNTVTSAAGIKGNAAQFTAANSEDLSAADPAVLSNGSKVSWSFWANPNTTTVNRTAIGKWTFQTDGEYVIQTGAATATDLTMYIATSATDNGTGCRMDFASAFADNTLAHYIVIFDGTQTGDSNRLKVYKNGSALTLAVGAGAVPASILNGGATFYLGRFGGSLTRYWDGLIDEAGIWNRVLTAAEISYLYNAGVGRTYNSGTGLFE